MVVSRPKKASVAKITAFLCCSLFSFFVNACAGLTDDREAKTSNALRQRVDSESRGAIKVDSFSKANGYERSIGGEQLYVLEWIARLSIQRDVWKGGNNLIGYWNSFAVMDERPADLESLAFASSPKQVEMGTKIDLSGESVMRKTDNGWRVEALEVKSFNEIPDRPKVNSSNALVGGWESADGLDMRVVELESGRFHVTLQKMRAVGDFFCTPVGSKLTHTRTADGGTSTSTLEAGPDGTLVFTQVFDKAPLETVRLKRRIGDLLPTRWDIR